MLKKNTERLLPTGYPMYDAVYGNEIPTEQYYVIKFDTIPSRMSDSTNYDPSVVGYFKSIGFVKECCVFTTNRRMDQSSLHYSNKK